MNARATEDQFSAFTVSFLEKKDRIYLVQSSPLKDMRPVTFVADARSRGKDSNLRVEGMRPTEITRKEFEKQLTDDFQWKTYRQLTQDYVQLYFYLLTGGRIIEA